VKTALVEVDTIYSTRGTFAAVLQDGTVLTWGNSADGGDSYSVKTALVEVDTIYSTRYAFAALLQDGTLVTWGRSAFGGNSSSVKTAFVEVDTIYSTHWAFAAVLTDTQTSSPSNTHEMQVFWWAQVSAVSIAVHINICLT